MRRFIVLCAAFAFVSGASAAVAQTQPATHAKHAAARKNAAQPAPPPADTRPRYKRDDVPVPVVTVPAATAARAAQPKRGAAPKAAAVQPVPSPADPRPRYKRDDVPAPVAATPAVAAKRHHTVRKLPSEDSASAGPASERATRRDVAACAQAKDHAAAIAGCTRVIDDVKQKPKARAAAYYNRANAHVAMGDQAAAITDYDEALKLDPKSATGLNNRGTAKNETGDAEGAIADFGEAIKLNKTFASAYFNRANVYAAQGEADKAIEDYTAAIKYNRRNINAYIARGALYLATASVANAHADVTHAARMDRRNAYAIIWEDIVERRAKQKGVLLKGTKGLDMKAWPAPVIRLFAGQIKQDDVMLAADNPNPAVKKAQACEANFYGGQYALIEGQRDDAMKLFDAAAKDCPHGFLEGIAASAELKGMGQKVGAN